ncbi:MAG: dTDP-glucose 4,6-dehydratase [Patescibacteria group bacterium]|nr:dTDP-glucose 4,6-dehydratase [Patescibacteria group bacterium]
MKILVTGGAGFIGSNFIHYWLEKNPEDQIVNLDALTYAGNLDNLKSIQDNKNYHFVKGDISDKEIVNNLFKNDNFDLVVHFAAESHVDRSIENSTIFLQTNVLGTHNLLEAAKKSGNIRFHHISTDEVFGSLNTSDKPFNENTPYDPHSPYSASKAASDHLVRSYFHTHKLPITISNCSNNYGPFQFPEKLIPLFITNLIQGQKVPVYGKGNNVRDWIHVDDHNRGVESVIKKGQLGETYCLGGASEKHNMEITKELLSLMSESEEKIKYVEDRKGHDFRYAIDFSKAEKELDWRPQIDFTDGLKQTVEWYKENRSWWEKLKK